MSDINYSSGNLFVINALKNGGKADVNSTIIVGSNTTLSDVVDLKIGNTAQEDPNRAISSQFVSPITSLSDSGDTALLSISDYSGYVALELDETPEVGQMVNLTGDYPLHGSYLVVDVDGDTAITDVPFKDCYVIGDGATYTLFDATMTDGGLPTTYKFGGDACNIPSPIPTGGAHKFYGYRQRTYENCWECFTGELNPCDVTITNVTLWTDQAEDGPKVYFTEPCAVKEGNSDGTSAAVGTDNPAGQNEI